MEWILEIARLFWKITKIQIARIVKLCWVGLGVTVAHWCIAATQTAFCWTHLNCAFHHHHSFPTPAPPWDFIWSTCNSVVTFLFLSEFWKTDYSFPKFSNSNTFVQVFLMYHDLPSATYGAKIWDTSIWRHHLRCCHDFKQHLAASQQPGSNLHSLCKNCNPTRNLATEGEILEPIVKSYQRL